jgi:hypothetical protein
MASAAIERSSTPTASGALAPAPVSEPAATPSSPALATPGVQAQGGPLTQSRAVWTLARDQTPDKRTATPIQ